MNGLLLVVVSNLLVACSIACLGYFVGRTGRHARIAHLIWLAVFMKLVSPPLVLAPIGLPNAWIAPLRSVSQVLSIKTTTLAGTSGVQLDQTQTPGTNNKIGIPSPKHSGFFE